MFQRVPRALQAGPRWYSLKSMSSTRASLGQLAGSLGQLASSILVLNDMVQKFPL